jgi:putative nucleotidyltransferase with HDIG domain
MSSTNLDRYISATRLRIGIYVHVDLPWFQHPFTLNSFRIGNEDQIRELRELGKTCFRYDPERSDCVLDAADEMDFAPSAETSPVDDAEPPAKRRLRILDEHRQRLSDVGRAFHKSAAILRNLKTMSQSLLDHPATTLQETGVLVDQMTQAFLEYPEVTLHLMGEEHGGEDIYSHHLNVAVLSMMVARESGFTPEQIHTIGLGALLHDIGLSKVPERLLKMRPDEYTQPERALRAMHCEYGLDFGKDLGLPEGVQRVIHQHHELIDGSGYPQGLVGDEMTPEARIVSLVNYYERLCNPLDPAQSMTPHGALSLMFGPRRAKFDADALQHLIRCLGIYPPGSFVTLSNDATALVVSVNRSQPLRPCVLVYDEKIPKEKAPFLDLEQETDINIVGAMRLAMLPPAVAAYLSPRRRIVYFFDSHALPGNSREDV